ncbi:PEP/pyruvate-binding domain-containing protein [Nocardia concava]|uniref:PEP/pyruvate-binding domain-containing protein n=1 Tax=Nocardia concava TaxID=257281 RepID=UPI00031EA2B1|nr:PEP/pyruvate-binding domain-containing protein [Nocardia concava]
MRSAVERFETPEISRARFGGKGFFLTKLREMHYAVPPFRVLEGAALRRGGISESELDGLLTLLRAEAAAIMDVDPGSVAFAVRSSAPVSMPGMMDTMLGVGLSPADLPALTRRLGGVDAAWGMLCIGAEGLCRHVAGITVEQTRPPGPVAYHRLLAAFERATGTDFPDTPAAQAKRAVDAVAASWNNRRAREYRAVHGISEDDRPSVVIQAMAYGTAGARSGSGVVFSHDPLTGVRGLHGEFLGGRTGESLVAGTVTPAAVAELARTVPTAHAELAAYTDELFGWLSVMVEVEFVVEHGTLWLVQVRPAIARDRVHNTVAVDAWRAGILDRAEALRRLRLDALFAEAPPCAEPGRATLLADGIAASSGVAVGRLVRDSQSALMATEPVVLLRPRTEPEDFAGMVAAVAVVTLEGGAGSHAAVVARELGRPAVVGAAFGDPAWPGRSGAALVTVCGTTGRVWLGAVPIAEGAVTGWPGDLIGIPEDTTVFASLEDFMEAVPEAVALDEAGDPAGLPASAVVITSDADAADVAAEHVRVAFVCVADSGEKPWRTTLPEATPEFVIAAAPTQRRYVHALLALRATASHRSETSP